MEKIRVVEPGQKLRSKDRDGLYKRRDYWHYELIIDGKKRSFRAALSARKSLSVCLQRLNRTLIV